MGKEFLNTTRRSPRQALQDVLEVRVGVTPVDARRVQQAHDRSAPLARAQAASEQPVRSPKGGRTLRRPG